VFGKNGRTRAIPIPQDAWSMLVQIRRNTGADDPVFASRSARRFDRGRVVGGLLPALCFLRLDFK
jgi:hypothetical protein